MIRLASTVAAAALLAVVTWYLLRERDAAPSPAPAPAAREAALPATAPPAQPPALPTPAEDDPTPVVDHISQSRASHVDATHAAMQAIGRRCFEARTPRPHAPNEPDDSVGRLELRLRVQVARGSARVETAEVVTERRLRADIRDCIVDASRAARWSVAAPDGTHEIVELFRLGDFIAVPRADSPPSAPPTR